MPHWNGIIDTTSPPILEGCNGDPVAVREKLYAETPKGASITAVHWEDGKDRARISVEGPNAEDFLATLEARDVVQLVSSRERKAQRDGAE